VIYCCAVCFVVDNVMGMQGASQFCKTRRARSGMFLFLGLLLLSFSPADASNSWSPSTFPNPQADPASCGRSHVAKSWVCDPDKILTKKSADVVEGILKDIADAREPYAPAKNCGGGQRVNEGYQASFRHSSSVNSHSTCIDLQKVHCLLPSLPST